MGWLWWLGGALVLAVVEILTLDLVLLMFVGGAVAGLVANALGADVVVQVLVFAVTSVVLLVTLRPWLLRHWRSRTPLVETNAAAHVGREATVVTEVGERHGRVKLVGEVWTARAESPGQTFPAGSTVQVVRIEGATAVVGPSAGQSSESTAPPRSIEPATGTPGPGPAPQSGPSTRPAGQADRAHAPDTPDPARRADGEHPPPTGNA